MTRQGKLTASISKQSTPLALAYLANDITCISKQLSNVKVSSTFEYDAIGIRDNRMLAAE
jgi:hypothetical protein